MHPFERTALESKYSCKVLGEGAKGVGVLLSFFSSFFLGSFSYIIFFCIIQNVGFLHDTVPPLNPLCSSLAESSVIDLLRSLHCPSYLSGSLGGGHTVNTSLVFRVAPLTAS